jgi:hypothetical protein
MIVDGFEQQGGMAHPVEGRHEHQGHALDERQQKTGDEAHVVVQRQPADNHIVF